MRSPTTTKPSLLRHALSLKWIAGFLLALLLASIFVGLSSWQISRAQHRDDVVQNAQINEVADFNEIFAALEPMPGYLADQKVALSGEFAADQQVIVPGRVLDGETGYWIVTMFYPEGARISADAQVPPEDDAPIAIPLVRGWAASEETAAQSTPPAGTATLIGRMGAIEPPEQMDGMPAGQVNSVSTSQLVNIFDVHSYSGMVFPELESEAAVNTGDLVAFPAPFQEPDNGFNLQSAAYALEWLLFAAFALYIWFSLMRDDYRAVTAVRGASRNAADGVEFVVVKESGEKNLHE